LGKNNPKNISHQLDKQTKFMPHQTC